MTFSSISRDHIMTHTMTHTIAHTRVQTIKPWRPWRNVILNPANFKKDYKSDNISWKKCINYVLKIQ